MYTKQRMIKSYGILSSIKVVCEGTRKWQEKLDYCRMRSLKFTHSECWKNNHLRSRSTGGFDKKRELNLKKKFIRSKRASNHDIASGTSKDVCRRPNSVGFENANVKHLRYRHLPCIVVPLILLHFFRVSRIKHRLTLYCYDVTAFDMVRLYTCKRNLLVCLRNRTQVRDKSGHVFNTILSRGKQQYLYKCNNNRVICSSLSVLFNIWPSDQRLKDTRKY